MKKLIAIFLFFHLLDGNAKEFTVNCVNPKGEYLYTFDDVKQTVTIGKGATSAIFLENQIIFKVGIFQNTLNRVTGYMSARNENEKYELDFQCSLVTKRLF